MTEKSTHVALERPKVPVYDDRGSRHVAISRTDYDPSGVPSFGYSLTINGVGRQIRPSHDRQYVACGEAEGTPYVIQSINAPVRPGDRVTVRDAAGNERQFVVG